MKKLWLIIFLFFISCGFGTRYAGLTSKEKSVFLKIEELKYYGLNTELTSDKARVRKFDFFSSLGFLGGFSEYEYEIEFSTPDKDDFIYIFNFVTKINYFSSKTSDYYQRAGEKIGAYGHGMELRYLERFARYGDGSESYLLLKNDKPVGNMIKIYDGDFAFIFVVYGFYFDNPELWNAIARSKMSRIKELLE